LKPAAELTAFSERLGHNFKKPELLIQAMTHSSLSSATRGDNQRLEFLGDRVLGLSISDALFHKDSDAPEGLLAPRFNALVRKETCAQVAIEIKLGEALKMGRSEMLSGGRRKIAVLGDAMEAVIGAVYLDAGYVVARDMVVRLWANHIDNAAHDARDPKTMLQEWAQAKKLPTPKYIEIGRSGPDHAPIFTIEVSIETGQSARAQAQSKRAASQEAAAGLLGQLES
jgi:ribonuclease-3|tara:strand:- start:3741 stop:4421 length:681 start_codon:yes stop_codon:yes gene_type:complete